MEFRGHKTDHFKTSRSYKTTSYFELTSDAVSSLNKTGQEQYLTNIIQLFS